MSNIGSKQHRIKISSTDLGLTTLSNICAVLRFVRYFLFKASRKNDLIIPTQPLQLESSQRVVRQIMYTEFDYFLICISKGIEL